MIHQKCFFCNSFFKKAAFPRKKSGEAKWLLRKMQFFSSKGFLSVRHGDRLHHLVRLHHRRGLPNCSQ